MAETPPPPNKLQARIAGLTTEVADRTRLLKMVEKERGWDNFFNTTIQLQGHLHGLQEAVSLVSELPAPTPDTQTQQP